MDDYQLDDYYRNAMLLFCNSATRTGKDLAGTFQKYRFIVDKYEDLSSSEIDAKCKSFFSRNFSEYGAVAVVVIEPEVIQDMLPDERYVCTGTLGTPIGPGMLQATDKSYHESIILKYFTTNVPQTLRGKPKIYITKTRSITQRIAIHNYEDILALHFPFEKRYYKDIFISELCNNIEESGENEDLLEIIKDTIYERREVEETDTLQKIESIYDFLGQEYVDSFVKPFFTGTPSSYSNNLGKNELTEKPKLTCTFTKRLYLPSDIYYNQNTLQPRVSKR